MLICSLSGSHQTEVENFGESGFTLELRSECKLKLGGLRESYGFLVNLGYFIWRDLKVPKRQVVVFGQ